jgi:hypothetical protein
MKPAQQSSQNRPPYVMGMHEGYEDDNAPPGQVPHQQPEDEDDAMMKEPAYEATVESYQQDEDDDGEQVKPFVTEEFASF